MQLTDETDVIQHLSIIDITGREVKVIWKTGSIVELNLEQEPAGIYFLNVITNTGRYTSRISVNK
ncbi:MAG: T9SS type A sorting domain-containing protein [Bacteroidetes bacterium]|nr:T9SS type A sorting domain-containing protein [Bacteroidota bacterium]